MSPLLLRCLRIRRRPLSHQVMARPPTQSVRDDALTGPVGTLVRRRRHALVAVAAAHGASNLRVFGSVAQGTEGDDSDVDLLVDLPPGMGLLGMARLQADLGAVLDGHRIDLVPSASLKPGVRERITSQAIDLCVLSSSQSTA